MPRVRDPLPATGIGKQGNQSEKKMHMTQCTKYKPKDRQGFISHVTCTFPNSSMRIGILFLCLLPLSHAEESPGTFNKLR